MINLSIVILLLLPVFSLQAATSLDIVINEIAWMGTEISSNNEWIELYNNTNAPVDLEGWTLKAADGSPEIKLTNIIPAQSFYLLERTDDETIPNVSANQIYKGALGNNGENLELSDNFGNLIDSADCGSGWFAGDNSIKQTMERKNSLSESDSDNWGMSLNPGGTPKTKNSLTIESQPLPKPTQVPQPKPEPQLEEEVKAAPPEIKQPEIVYPLGIRINEILSSPAGPDEREEWIEIFNQNNFEVELSGWQITDIMGSIKTYTFPEGSKISPQGFLVLPRPEIKITLNNDSDGLKLIQPGGKVIDEVIYKKAPQGQSYNRTDFNWIWSVALSPGSANIISAATTSKENPETNLQKEVKNKTQSEKDLASISKTLKQIQPGQNYRTFFIFFAALIIAIFSGTVILTLKRKIKSIASLKKLE